MKILSFTLLIVIPLLTIYSQDTINVPADYSTIQAGIDASNNGDIVLVADGTYYENIDFIGKAITVASHFLVDGDKGHIDNTIIDANDSGSVVIFHSGEDTTSILYGFSIIGGNEGGINFDSSGAKIINNRIVGNENGFGGGICIRVSERIVIEKNIIGNNVARGIRISSGAGGGIYMNDVQEGRVSNNIIVQNLTLRREGLAAGGAINIYSCNSLLISNNTMVNNHADGGHGGGLFYMDNIPPIIMNNIIWGNTAEVDSQICAYTGNLEIYFTDIQGGWSGVGNIDVYPEFVDTANGDYHLKNSSPCIGAGIDSLEIAGTWYYCPLTDLEGNPRPNPAGTMPDMGAYESPLSVSGVENYLSLVPKTYSLEQNFPNPFNSSSVIRYSVPQSSNVVIKVYDILGNKIEILVNEEKPVGTYEITWTAVNLPSGVYFYRLQAGDFIETKKMILIK